MSCLNSTRTINHLFFFPFGSTIFCLYHSQCMAAWVGVIPQSLFSFFVFFSTDFQGLILLCCMKTLKNYIRFELKCYLKKTVLSHEVYFEQMNVFK